MVRYESTAIDAILIEGKVPRQLMRRAWPGNVRERT